MSMLDVFIKLKRQADILEELGPLVEDYLDEEQLILYGELVQTIHDVADGLACCPTNEVDSVEEEIKHG